MIIETTRFGLIEISDDTIITFPQGLYGFEDFDKYCLIDRDSKSPFKWLQSVQEPALAVIVADPYLFFPDYEIEISGEDEKKLSANSPSDLAVFGIITVAKDAVEVTMNLLGPLVINFKLLIGRQIVLTDEIYRTKHPLPIIKKERVPVSVGTMEAA